jgi:ribonuclease Z
MVTHLSYDDAMIPEMVAGIRTHWDGLFQFGAPDVVVVNVTKDAIWTRRAALPEDANFCRPSKKEAVELFDLSLTHTTVDFPNPRTSLAENEGPVPRNVEYDPHLYYPPDVYRKPDPVFPKNFKIDIKQMMAEKIEAKVQAKLDDVKENPLETAEELRAKIEALQERLKSKLQGK